MIEHFLKTLLRLVLFFGDGFVGLFQRLGGLYRVRCCCCCCSSLHELAPGTSDVSSEVMRKKKERQELFQNIKRGGSERVFSSDVVRARARACSKPQPFPHWIPLAHVESFLMFLPMGQQLAGRARVHGRMSSDGGGGGGGDGQEE